MPIWLWAEVTKTEEIHVLCAFCLFLELFPVWILFIELKKKRVPSVIIYWSHTINSICLLVFYQFIYILTAFSGFRGPNFYSFMCLQNDRKWWSELLVPELSESTHVLFVYFLITVDSRLEMDWWPKLLIDSQNGDSFHVDSVIRHFVFYLLLGY